MILMAMCVVGSFVWLSAMHSYVTFVALLSIVIWHLDSWCCRKEINREKNVIIHRKSPKIRHFKTKPLVSCCFWSQCSNCSKYPFYLYQQVLRFCTDQLFILITYKVFALSMTYTFFSKHSLFKYIVMSNETADKN